MKKPDGVRRAFGLVAVGDPGERWGDADQWTVPV